MDGRRTMSIESDIIHISGKRMEELIGDATERHGTNNINKY